MYPLVRRLRRTRSHRLTHRPIIVSHVSAARGAHRRDLEALLTEHNIPLPDRPTPPEDIQVAAPSLKQHM